MFKTLVGQSVGLSVGRPVGHQESMPCEQSQSHTFTVSIQILQLFICWPESEFMQVNKQAEHFWFQQCTQTQMRTCVQMELLDFGRVVIKTWTQYPEHCFCCVPGQVWGMCSEVQPPLAWQICTLQALLGNNFQGPPEQREMRHFGVYKRVEELQVIRNATVSIPLARNLVSLA